MALTVTWLQRGNVVHGYRRVFVVHEDGKPQGVVVIAPMGYEGVFAVLEWTKSAPEYQGITVDDPSLLWGLSLVQTRLLHEQNLVDDDGFTQIRAPKFDPSILIDGQRYVEAVRNGSLTLDGRDS